MIRVITALATVGALGLAPAPEAPASAARAQTPATVVVTPDALTVPEDGGAATFAVRLSAPPASRVAIMTRMNGTGDWSTPPVIVTFGPTDWDQPQSVTVYAVSDPDTIDDTTIVTLSASGYLADHVTLTQLDDGRTGLHH
ncbi:hypothetical protein [Actinoplanes sp. NPDC051494]|uniref:hypothetical protein n=1 Tax=Actinoplanes sp. NPDC051494 TaxID=3363907 RepID=UPI0037B8F60F